MSALPQSADLKGPRGEVGGGGCRHSRRTPHLTGLSLAIVSSQARVVLYRNEIELLSMVFNATDSDKNNWFSKTSLIRSPWTDLDTERQSYFSILGDVASKRSFYINKKNDSCNEDVGWLMVSTGKLCDYESRHILAAFTYSKLQTSVNWNDYGKRTCGVRKLPRS